MTFLNFFISSEDDKPCVSSPALKSQTFNLPEFSVSKTFKFFINFLIPNVPFYFNLCLNLLVNSVTFSVLSKIPSSNSKDGSSAVTTYQTLGAD